MEHHLPDQALGHETRDAGVRAILISGAALALVVAIVGALMYGAFLYLLSHRAVVLQTNPMAAGQSVIPPGPRVEEHPALGLQELHTQEDRALTTYGWADKKSGVVRIPLDRAMELQLQRGFPTRKEAAK